tara:strand:- start:230 stop:958 length:729 start_codon:yes stop_codon:yes gene_type:complete
MNNTTLQIKFKQRLNKLASNDYDNLECWQIVEAFNKAQVEWCRRQLHGNNMYKEGDEMSKRRIDDLQLLITDLGLTFIEEKDYVESTNFPSNYLEYKRMSTEAYDKCCPYTIDKAGNYHGRSMTVYLSEESNVDLIMRDPLKRPDFDWGETYCTIQGNRIRIYKRDFDIISPLLTYYRQPLRIQILNCIDPYTLVQSPEEVECEFKDDIVELIIDEACSIIAGDINDVNTYMRGSANAEKNN